MKNYYHSMHPGIVALYGTLMPELKDVPNLGMVQKFLELLMSKIGGNPQKVDKIMWGGAGKIAGQCQDMSLEWLRGEVLELLGEEGRKVEQLLTDIDLTK